VVSQWYPPSHPIVREGSVTHWPLLEPRDEVAEVALLASLRSLLTHARGSEPPFGEFFTLRKRRPTSPLGGVVPPLSS
jgi:hypothetical protein